MSVSSSYFSKSNYIDIIKYILSSEYEIVTVADAFSSDRKCCILRHDVDFDVECAYEIARIENSLGVSSTFFFMITSEMYNISDAINREMIHEIIKMGHEIGLHWDSTVFGTNGKKEFMSQVMFLESIIGKKVLSAAQHNPTQTPFFDINTMIKNNVYSTRFANRYEYISDSIMSFRDYTPECMIDKKVNFQFLSHPVWWIMNGSTASAKMTNLIGKKNDDLRKKGSEIINLMQNALTNRKDQDIKFKAVFR